MKAIINITILIAGILIGCKSTNNKIPKETAKIIETQYYEPLKQGEKWVCGKTISNFSGDMHNIVYYDSFGNEILKKNILDKGEVYIVIRKYYTSPEKHLLKRVIMENLIQKSSEEASYIRDSDGKLMKIKGSVSGMDIDIRASSFEYDRFGNRIKEQEEGNGKTTYIKKIPNESMEVTQYDTYDANCNYSYDNKYGLIKSKIVIRDKDSDLPKYTKIEYYKYGHLHEITEYQYEYDNQGRLTSELKDDKLTLIGRIPDNLTEKEEEEYIINNYYSKSPSKQQSRTHNVLSYNEQGDCIGELYTKESGFSNLPIKNQNIIKRIYEYEYNNHGEWIKCIVFESSNTNEIPKKPSMIILRTITYL